MSRRRTSSPRGGRASGRPRRGSVMVIVLWTLGITAIIGSALQIHAFRQANLGHQSLHEIEARWAARAGVENAIATMGFFTEDPNPDDAFELSRKLSSISYLEFETARSEVLHHAARVDVNGPLDVGGRININRPQSFDIFELLEDASPDQMMAIIDWTDEDDEPQLYGAEADYYLAQSLYEPRNGPFRSVAEMELVAGIWPDIIRGEDTNLNGRRDPNEDDRTRSMPEDNGDGWIDNRWSGMLTVSSVDDGATDSGLPRLHLRRATADELIERLGVSEEQANALRNFGRTDGANIWDLIGLPLGSVGGDGGGDGDGEDGEEPVEVPALDVDQLRAAMAELSMFPLHDRQPGRININTAAPDMVRDIVELLGLDISVADDLIYLRTSRPQGITSEVEFGTLRERGGGSISVETHRQLASVFGVRANVFQISSIGRSSVSGTEIEIICTVDRSTVPVRILEYREQ
ncbi:MAG: general secretion pathway protein GspK [Phycisphaerales bacterium]